jgi:hypothetical protein
MANDVSKKKSGVLGLPTDFAAKLVSGIAESRASTQISGGGKPLLRMSKAGEWMFGQANDECQEGSTWAINPVTLSHGYCCWVDGGPGQKNELKGEIMASMAEPKPRRPEPIGDTPYAEQRSFDLRCLDGADEGVEVLYKTSSVGGMRAVDAILAEIQKQVPLDPTHPCPVVLLQNDSYPHSKWGKIYVPVFVIVGWSDFEGDVIPVDEDGSPGTAALVDDSEPEEEAEEELPVKTKRAAAAAPVATKTKKPALAAGKAPAKAASPAPTAAAHTGQRRRPGR